MLVDDVQQQPGRGRHLSLNRVPTSAHGTVSDGECASARLRVGLHGRGVLRVDPRQRGVVCLDAVAFIDHLLLPEVVELNDLR